MSVEESSRLQGFSMIAHSCTTRKKGREAGRKHDDGLLQLLKRVNDLFHAHIL